MTLHADDVAGHVLSFPVLLTVSKSDNKEQNHVLLKLANVAQVSFIIVPPP